MKYLKYNSTKPGERKPETGNRRPIVRLMLPIKFIAVFVIVLCCLVATPQSNPQSPYSRFGVGTLQEPGNVNSVGLGGITTVMDDRFSVNLSNPATYSRLVRTGLQVSAKGSMLTVSNGERENKLNGSQLHEVAFGFTKPGSKWGFALGLSPYSSSGYALTDEQTIPDIGNVTYTYDGEGGINRAIAGASRVFYFKKKDIVDTCVTLHPSIAIGANLNYYFGSLKQTRKVIFNDVTYAHSRISNTTSLYALGGDAGIHVSLPLSIQRKDCSVIKRSTRLLLGADYSLATSLNAKFSELTESFYYFTALEVVIDTSAFAENVEGSLTLPQRISLGAGWSWFSKGFGTLFIGGEYRMQDWTKHLAIFEGIPVANNLQRASTISVGAEFNSDNVEKFFGRWSYRVGWRNSKTYLMLNDNQIAQQAITFGTSIPLLWSKSFSRLNLAVETGSGGTTDNNLLKENFVNFYVGFTFSPFFKTDEWFVYRKYD